MADPRNPFDPTVIRGPWRASPQGEGGGGGLAPRPPTPNRFKEIMGEAPKEKLPTRYEIRRAEGRGEIEPTKARELEARLRDPTMTVYKPEGLGVRGSAAEVSPTGQRRSDLNDLRLDTTMRRNAEIEQEALRTGRLTDTQRAKYRYDELLGRPSREFQDRRDAQINFENQQRAIQAERAEALRAQEQLTLVQQRRAERGAAADRWLAQRQGPRELTPDLQRERAAEARLGTEIAPPTKDYRGFIRETMELGSIVTNPRSGYSQFDMILPGGSSVKVPFKTRGEALEFAARKPTAQEAAAKAALQRQRLGMAHGQSAPPQFTE